MLPPKTEYDALELLNAMEGYYSRAFDNFKEDDRYYEGDIAKYVFTPDGYEVTIPTTARAIVDEAVDNIVPDDLLITYAPRGIGEKPETDADLCRRVLKAAWHYWRAVSSDSDPVQDFAKNLFKHGKAVFKVAPDWSLWPTLDDEGEADLRAMPAKQKKKAIKMLKELRQRHFPVAVRSLSPSNIMEDPTVSTRKLWCIERYEEDLTEVCNYYPQIAEKYHLNGYYYDAGVAQVHEIWTAAYVDNKGRFHKGKHWVFVDRERVLNEDNELGDLPYVIRHSGFGTEMYTGEPEKKSVGFFTAQVRSMLLAEARRFTHIEAIITQSAFPVAMVDEEMSTDTLDFSPGAVNFIPEGQFEHLDKFWLKTPMPDPNYFQSLQNIASQIERGTTQKAIRGAGVPGTTSAAQYNTLTAQAKLRLDPVRRATEQAMSEVNALALYFIDKIFATSVSINAAEAPTSRYTVGPGNIKGHYVNQVTFQPNEDAVKERKMMLANEAISKGGYSPYDAYVFAGFENPMELISRRLAYDIMQDPLIKRFIAKQKLLDWGLDADAIELQEQRLTAEKQAMLQQVQQEILGGGSMAGIGDVMSPGGSPPGGGVVGPAQQPQVPPQAMPRPDGRPSELERGPLSALAGEIRGLNQIGA